MALDMGKRKRTGSRRASHTRSLPDRTSLLLCVGLTLCVVAWGYQVFAAIDFGITARGGESAAWGFLALACAGAAVCLFIGLLLGARLLRRLGITAVEAAPPSDAPPAVAYTTPASSGQNNGLDSSQDSAQARGEDTPPTYTPPPGPYRGKRVAR